MSALRSVAFRCEGHPAVRASHRKSIEFTRDADITARATCVLGVAADVDPDALAGFRGPVSLTVECGGRTDVVRAVANPAFRPGAGIIVRTSRHHSGDTLALDADKGAAGLDRELAGELSQPHAVVTVTVSELLAAARPEPLDAPFVGSPVEGADLRLAVLRASGLTDSDHALIGPLDDRGAARPGGGEAVREALRAAVRSGVGLAWRVSDDELPAVLDEAESAAGERPVFLAVEPASRQGIVLRGAAAGVRDRWVALGRPPGEAVLVVGEAAGPARDGLDAMLAALLDEGVSSKTVARALAALPEQSYRDAYQRVLDLKAHGEGR